MYDEHRTTMGRVFAPMDGEDATRFWSDHETWASAAHMIRELEERHNPEFATMFLPALTQREEVERIERRYAPDGCVRSLVFYVKQELGLDLTGCETMEDVYGRLT